MIDIGQPAASVLVLRLNTTDIFKVDSGFRNSPIVDLLLRQVSHCLTAHVALGVNIRRHRQLLRG